jgi:hypothetical protein
MRLSTVLTIALGVFLGGVALRLLDHLVANVELNLLERQLSTLTHRAEPRPLEQMPPPGPDDRDYLPKQPVAAAKPCQVTNSRGETFSCAK